MRGKYWDLVWVTTFSCWPMRSVEALRSLRCFTAASVASSRPQGRVSSFSSFSTVGADTGRARTLLRAERISMVSVLATMRRCSASARETCGLEDVVVSDHPELVLVLGDLEMGLQISDILGGHHFQLLGPQGLK